MSDLAIPELVQVLSEIEGAYAPGDLGDLGPEIRINQSNRYLVHKPLGFDGYPSEVHIPVYSKSELMDYPCNDGDSIERLAWYRSYHFGVSDWGIYLLRSGIYKVANALINQGLNPNLAISRARDFLIRHERTHFQTDLGVTSLELASNSSLFIPSRKRFRGTIPGWHGIEEGLANSYGYRILANDKKYIRNFLATSPDGYNDWMRYKKSTDLNTWRKILGDFLESTPGKPHLAARIACENSIKHFGVIPIYEIYDLASVTPGDSYFIGAIPQIIETSDFEKDLRKLGKGQPTYFKKWAGVKTKLSNGNIVGVHLEEIKKEKSLYSVRIDGDARAGLLRESGWYAIAAGHHDELYRRLNRL